MNYLKLSKNELEKLGFRFWNKESGIMLIPKELFEDVLAKLPIGTPLYCIDGKTYNIGDHTFDDDTRAGLVAYGLKPSE